MLEHFCLKCVFDVCRDQLHNTNHQNVIHPSIGQSIQIHILSHSQTVTDCVYYYYFLFACGLIWDLDVCLLNTLVVLGGGGVFHRMHRWSNKITPCAVFLMSVLTD